MADFHQAVGRCLSAMHLNSSEHEHEGTASRGNSSSSSSLTLSGSKTDFARDVESEERRGHWSNGKLAKRRAEASGKPEVVCRRPLSSQSEAEKRTWSEGISPDRRGTGSSRSSSDCNTRDYCPRRCQRMRGGRCKRCSHHFGRVQGVRRRWRAARRSRPCAVRWHASDWAELSRRDDPPAAFERHIRQNDCATRQCCIYQSKQRTL